MIDFISYLVIVVALLFVVYQHVYYRKQFKKIRKYPFFKLRDKIIYELAIKKKSERTLALYEDLNYMIAHVKKIKFIPYVKAMSHALDRVLEMIHSGSIKNFKGTDLELEFATLVIEMGKKNNILIRIVSSDLGFKFFMLKGIISFLRKKHLEEKEINTIKEVSNFNKMILKTV
jgi:hypothetical protein